MLKLKLFILLVSCAYVSLQAQNTIVFDDEIVEEQPRFNNEIVSVPVVPVEDTTTEVIFKIVEEMPEFPGGEQALWKYMSQTVYPDQARLDKLQGTVYVEFLIGKDGAISNVRIVRSSNHPILDESAKNQVANMPNWTPGKQNGKPVTVQYLIPVKFKL